VKYLITGGCGFLGSNIAAELINQGHVPIMFDNLSRYGSANNLSWLWSLGECAFIHGDIRNADDCNNLIEKFKPDSIFHLAGQVAMTTSIERPRFDFEVNAMGSLNLLEAVRNYCPSASIVYSSTNKVYGDLEQFNYRETETRYELEEFPEGLPETISLDFHSPYGCSKGSADQYMLDFSRIYGLKTAVFRHSSMYGGRQFSTAEQGWIGWFCGEAIRQSLGDMTSFTISGNGKQVRDVLYADDMVALYLSASKNIDQIAGQAFNVGGGIENSLSILELMELLEGLIGAKLSWKHIEARESDQRVFVADLGKIEHSLGWKPKTSKEKGISHMIDWVKSLKLNVDL
jgi:CDP-paratose 2-epimerase